MIKLKSLLEERFAGVIVGIITMDDEVFSHKDAIDHGDLWIKIAHFTSGKTIKHKWNKTDNQRKLKHYKCERCKAEKWWDPGFARLIYQDRFGKQHYRAPECVLPNTKL